MKTKGIVAGLLTLGILGLLGASHAPQSISEGFESGITLLDGTDVPWVLGGEPFWAVTDAEKHGGAKSAHSRHTQAGQVSWLQVTMDIRADGEIVFWYKISSGAGTLTFSIDCTEVLSWKQAEGWK